MHSLGQRPTDSESNYLQALKARNRFNPINRLRKGSRFFVLKMRWMRIDESD